MYTFTKHSYQKLQTVQFVKCTHGFEEETFVGTGFSMFTPVPRQLGWWRMLFLTIVRVAQSPLVLRRTMVIYNVDIVSHNLLSPWCRNAEWRNDIIFCLSAPEKPRGTTRRSSTRQYDTMNEQCISKQAQPSHCTLSIHLSRKKWCEKAGAASTTPISKCVFFPAASINH